MYDVVIIGSGVAALSCSLSIDPKLKVLLLTKSKMETTNSTLAQGGIAATITENKGDVESHIEDTLKAGCYVCNEDAVRFMIEKSKQAIDFLIESNVKFDMKDGKPSLTREAAHSQRRILHAGGDRSGKFILEGLIDSVKARENIKIIEFANVRYASEVKYGEYKVTYQVKNRNFSININNLVIATGGYANIFNNSSNNVNSNGDGIDLAIRLGLQLENLAYVQFHPTTFKDLDAHRNFLLTEALRGEGAKLWSSKNGYFMKNYHELEDIAPRDITARAINSELHIYGNEVKLDCRPIGSETNIKSRFVGVSEYLDSKGYDIANEMIPVVPAAHYSIGGIKTNLKGETNLSGVYACGEVASTGVHGANRLASNSLLECVVFGMAIGNTIEKKEEFEIEPSNISVSKKKNATNKAISTIISRACSIERSYSMLRSMKSTLEDLEMCTIDVDELVKIKFAKMILEDCISKPSLGCHYVKETK